MRHQLFSISPTHLAAVTDLEPSKSYDLGHYRGHAELQEGYCELLEKNRVGALKFREFKKLRGKG